MLSSWRRKVELSTTSPIFSWRTWPLWSLPRRHGVGWNRIFYLYIYLFYTGKWCLVSADFKTHIKTAFHLNKHRQQTEAEKKGSCKSGSRKNKTLFRKGREGDEKTGIIKWHTLSSLAANRGSDVWTSKASACRKSQRQTWLYREWNLQRSTWNDTKEKRSEESGTNSDVIKYVKSIRTSAATSPTLQTAASSFNHIQPLKERHSGRRLVHEVPGESASTSRLKGHCAGWRPQSLNE